MLRETIKFIRGEESQEYYLKPVVDWPREDCWIKHLNLLSKRTKNIQYLYQWLQHLTITTCPTLCNSTICANNRQNFRIKGYTPGLIVAPHGQNSQNVGSLFLRSTRFPSTVTLELWPKSAATLLQCTGLPCGRVTMIRCRHGAPAVSQVPVSSQWQLPDVNVVLLRTMEIMWNLCPYFLTVS